jgi:signal peptidase II
MGVSLVSSGRLTFMTALALLVVEACLLKPWVRDHALRLAQAPQPVLGNLLEVTAAFNTGVAFSGLSHWPVPWVVGFTGVLLASLVGLLVWQHQSNPHLTHGWRAVAWGAVLGGAVANWGDRLVYGSVTDYLRFGFWPEFAVMNLGDWGISLGATLLVLDALRQSAKPNVN